MSLQDSFEEFCRQNKFEINSQQKEIIYLLEKFLIHKETFLSSFFQKKEKFCFYLYGNVGVGKTMLLNFVYDRLEMKKQRLSLPPKKIDQERTLNKKKTSWIC